MADVIFERVAPVIAVQDIDAALERYGRLGFVIELDEPAQYGFVERGGDSFTSCQKILRTLAEPGVSFTSTCPTPMPFALSGDQLGSGVVS